MELNREKIINPFSSLYLSKSDLNFSYGDYSYKRLFLYISKKFYLLSFKFKAPHNIEKLARIIFSNFFFLKSIFMKSFKMAFFFYKKRICKNDCLQEEFRRRNFCNNLIIMTQRASQSRRRALNRKKLSKKHLVNDAQSRSLHVYPPPTKLASSANWVNGETFAFVGSRHSCDFPLKNEKNLS